jgi:hypothetical protein
MDGWMDGWIPQQTTLHPFYNKGKRLATLVKHAGMMSMMIAIHTHTHILVMNGKASHLHSIHDSLAIQCGVYCWIWFF